MGTGPSDSRNSDPPTSKKGSASSHTPTSTPRSPQKSPSSMSSLPKTIYAAAAESKTPVKCMSSSAIPRRHSNSIVKQNSCSAIDRMDGTKTRKRIPLNRSDSLTLALSQSPSFVSSEMNMHGEHSMSNQNEPLLTERRGLTLDDIQINTSDKEFDHLSTQEEDSGTSEDREPLTSGCLRRIDQPGVETGLKFMKDEVNTVHCRPHLILRALVYPRELKEHMLSSNNNQIKLVFGPIMQTNSESSMLSEDEGFGSRQLSADNMDQWEARVYGQKQSVRSLPVAILPHNIFQGVRRLYSKLVKRSYGQELVAHIIPDSSEEYVVLKIGLEQILHWTRGRIIAIVNVCSGGLQGKKMMKILQGLRITSFSHQTLSSSKKEWTRFIDALDEAMKCRTKHYGMRILSAGGDGTSSWSFELLDKAFTTTRLQKYFIPKNEHDRKVSPSMLQIDTKHSLTTEDFRKTIRQVYSSEGSPLFVPYPLGSGNDFCRVLGWGHETPSFARFGHVLLKLCNNRCITLLDRWVVTALDEHGEILQRKHMVNYFSMGYDADIVWRYQKDRKKNPEKYNTPWKNNYGHVESAIVRMFQPARPLKKNLEIICDGEEHELWHEDSSIAITNIPSIAKGVNYWGNPDQEALDPDHSSLTCSKVGDGKLEVMAVKGLVDIILIRTGVISSMRRLAQSTEIDIQLKSGRMPKVQIDGEAYDFGRKAKKLQIRHLTTLFALIGDVSKTRGCNVINF